MDKSTAELLLTEAHRINSPAFIADDPVQFPRRFACSKPDAEIVSLLAAHIAWGNRRMICRDAERLISETMGSDPYNWMMEEAYEAVPDEVNVHRTFFGRNLKHLMRGLRAIYAVHGSLDDFCRSCGASASETPAWHLAAAMNRVLADANGGVADSRCLPLNLDATALKRLNMALRWLVRRDGIVDLGLWESLTPAQLFVPVDVHVGNVARELGLITRRANDRRTALELTAELRTVCPDDPVLLDFALFGIGVSGRTAQL
ncbi:MAG: TIGR02757 family protein [Muribaculaceae bacterium]|nr:TIGR02757 family protein [Muribaculaceae bacterium]